MAANNAVCNAEHLPDSFTKKIAMKKVFYTFIVLCMCFHSFAQYPDNFSWLSTVIKKNQVVSLGPCNYFATIAAAETWYNMLYGSLPDLSEQHLYSPCVAAGTGKMLDYALTFITDSGVVNENNLSYQNNVTDAVPSNCFASALHVDPHFPCFAPHIWYSPGSTPDNIYFAASYQLLNFNTLYSGITNKNDRLKRILLNYGPILLNLNKSDIHSGSVHAYLLYGWMKTGTQVTWLFKDSWPGTDATMKFTGTFIDSIAPGRFTLNSGPFVLKPTKSGGSIINDAVYSKKLVGGAWTKEALIKQQIFAPTLDSNLAISVNGQPSNTPSQYISTTAATLNIENISQFDSFTVHWTFTPDAGTSAAVSFSAPNSANTNVSNVTEGYVTIRADITLANGVQLYVKRRIYTNISIPFKLVKTQDMCASGARVIKYEIQSRSSEPLPSSIVITYPWNLMPSTGTTAYQYYSTQYVANDVLLIDFYPPAGSGGSYGLIVTLHDPGYANIVDNSTVGGAVMPCAHKPARSGTGVDTGDENDNTPLSVYPNPAHSQVTVTAPVRVGKSFNMRLTDMNGHVLLTKKINGAITLDVSKYAKGVYIMQFTSSNKKEQPVIKKIIIN